MKKLDSTSSYNIAHIILLSVVVVVGIWFIVWAIISMSHADEKAMETSDEPCVQIAINTVATIWLDRPDQIPQKYIDIMTEKANRVVEVKTRGNCNGTPFVCEMGTIRSECDPCATLIARQDAINQHTVDLIQENCNIELD